MLVRRHPCIVTISVFVGLVALAIIARVLPHAPNFTPLAAVTLFGSYFFRRSYVAALLPITAMFLSDAILGFYDVPVVLAVYLSLAANVFFRPFLRRGLTPGRILLSSLVSSMFFFLATNAAVWWASGMYVRTSGGLVACYSAAIPFLRFGLMGDAIWSTVIFGGYAILNRACGPEGAWSGGIRSQTRGSCLCA